MLVPELTESGGMLVQELTGRVLCDSISVANDPQLGNVFDKVRVDGEPLA